MTRALVLGAGVSGLGAARLARRLGIHVTIYAEETSPSALGEGHATASGAWDRMLLDGVDVVIASPGFSERSLPIVEALEWGVPIWSEVEFASRHVEAPMIAVTGTNGKTTVTEATTAMLVESGIDAVSTGNIGTAISDQVGAGHALLVVEVSSFQLRFIDAFHPTSAAITNIASDHLDWHGSVHQYREAKARIFENQTASDLLVFDADDEGAAAVVGRARSELFPVSGARMPSGGGGRDDDRLVVGDVVVPVEEMASSDAIHLVNMAVAAALALRSSARGDAVARTLRRFRPGAHRRQLLAEVAGIAWVDDSKATNPHAAIASIRAHRSVVLIAGGLAKGLDILPVAREPNVRHVIGIGTAGPDLVAAAGDRGHAADDLATAVRIAAEVAMEGDTVLLAPACASFDQFSSYEERGDRFAQLVEEQIGVNRR